MKAGLKMLKKISRALSFCLIMVLLFNGMGMSGMVKAESQIKQALVVVDPGGSGFSLKIAQQIADKLSAKAIPTKLIKVNQFKTQALAGIDLLVLGGPTYMAQPSGGLKKFVANLNPASGLNALLFITGGSDCGGLAPLTQLVKAKGLNVIGSSGILTTAKETPDIEAKINSLIDKI